MYAIILGNAKSGKSVFLSLLYASMIKYSEESDGDFRFYSEPKVQKILGRYYNHLRIGNWPQERLTKELSLTFGYDTKSFGHKFKRLFSKSYEEPQIILDLSVFNIYDSSIEKNSSDIKPSMSIPLLLTSKHIQFQDTQII